MSRHHSIVVVFLTMTLYYASLMLPAIGPIFGDCEPGKGYEAFLFCLSAPFEGSLNWGCVFVFTIWLANPALWLGMFALLSGRCNWALCAGIVGLVLALLALGFDGELFLRQPGYWLWLASFLSFCLGSRYLQLRSTRHRVALSSTREFLPVLCPIRE